MVISIRLRTCAEIPEITSHYEDFYMLKQIKNLAKKATVAGTLALVSASSFAAGLGDIGTNIDFSDGKAAVTAVTVAVAGFLVVGLVARYILGFFKRV